MQLNRSMCPQNKCFFDVGCPARTGNDTDKGWQIITKFRQRLLIALLKGFGQLRGKSHNNMHRRINENLPAARLAGTDNDRSQMGNEAFATGNGHFNRIGELW